MKNLVILIVLPLFLFVTGCEEQMVVIPPFQFPESERVLLIEETSGVACPNCPSGSEEVEAMRQAFEGNVVAVVLYTDFLGEPLDESTLDFRTEEAQEIEGNLGAFFGKPSISISRIFFEEEGLTWLWNAQTWANGVQKVLTDSPNADVGITIETAYDEATRELAIDVILSPTVNASGDFRLGVMLTESGIVNAQEDNREPDGVVEDYVHNHVLRTMLTDVDGDQVASVLEVGKFVERSYTFTIPNEPEWWVPENMDVVAFVSRIDGENREILQAGEAHVLD